MKTSFDIEDELYEIFAKSPLAQAVDGEIYKGPDERPDDSQKEDIEIIVIGNQNGQIQNSTISLNIYTRDELDGNKYRRNKPRMQELASMVEAMFRQAINVAGYRITLGSQGAYPEHKVNQHYVNFKLYYNYYNRQ